MTLKKGMQKPWFKLFILTKIHLKSVYKPHVVLFQYVDHRDIVD